MNNKVILGLTGKIASGKSEVALFLEKEFEAETASFSQPLRQMLDILDLPQSRENMVWLGVDLRERFGQDILAKAVYRMIKKSSAKIVCLPNVRMDGDISVLKKLPNFHLIGIEADEKIRYQRLIKRGQNTDDGNKTWEQFLADNELPTEVNISKLIQESQFQINNNFSKIELFKRVRKIIEIIKGQQNES